jgi:sugar phosphate isomerase/epimerase
MPLPRLALAVIGDEIGPSLEEMISFCAEHEVRRLDMRTVEGKNLLGMTLDEVRTIRRTLDAAGIEVPTLVSPLLKWTIDGKPGPAAAVDFSFDPAWCPASDPFRHACEIATVLGASHMRIFSHLRYPGYQPKDLLPSIRRLLDLAERHGLVLEMENEPVCNVGSVAELAAFFTAMPEPLSPRLRPLVDIGNTWSIGAPPTDAEIGVLAPLVDLIHLKDRDLAAKRTVAVGDGDVPWPEELKRLLAGTKEPEVLASIETHCPHDARNATARSVAGLRRIAAEIGVTVV